MATFTIRNPILYASIILAASAAPAWADLPITTLAAFNGTNGSNPYAGVTLSEDRRTLYGTTQGGGANNNGSVFSVPIDGGAATVLASFNGTNGALPLGGLTLSGNTLYGMTLSGGAYNQGTVFAVPVSAGTPAVLASFDGTNGASPGADLTLSPDGTTLFGATSGGEGFTQGTVFSVPITGGAPTVLTSFNGTNGASPNARLTLVGNTLYGTTWAGGAFNWGTIFSVPIKGGKTTVLASFNGTNGIGPHAALTLSPDGTKLYGTTEEGGSSYNGTTDFGGGTVFSVPISGGTVTVLASFNGTNGQNPGGDLTLSGNMLLGTTMWGGANDCGAVFSVPIIGNTPTVLASFGGPNGLNPDCDLILVGNTLYGTTEYGGVGYDGVSNFGYGTVFAITVPEPASLLLLTLGTAGLLLLRHPRKG